MRFMLLRAGCYKLIGLASEEGQNCRVVRLYLDARRAELELMDRTANSLAGRLVGSPSQSSAGFSRTSHRIHGPGYHRSSRRHFSQIPIF